ncbi:MAG: bifunctional riboflavin kinase/FAD synthetase [Ktedonobacteraceae bacterium]|nr:bifunctional riboflavin kinase/FAD synthetase [Ktedonobacteraceae bacterium]
MEYTATIAEHTPIAITIGNFDGIHKGHQRLLQELHTLALDLSCVPVVVTFSPHTLMVVRPDIFVRYLTTTNEKLALAHQYGNIADHIVISFTQQVAAMSAEAFMDNLRAHYQLKGLVVGANFSLGHNRKGDINFLEAYGRQHNIAVRSISLEEAEHTRISSTRIRTLVDEGHISDANLLLGHPVILSGIVSHGDHRGRLIGFPTANLRPDPHRLLPADGVYAVRVRVPGEPTSDPYTDSSVYNGVVNIGVRPTFEGRTRLVEAHLLDTTLDLYDRLISLDFIARLRGEQRFSGIDTLKAQITSDVQHARQILSA